MSDELQPQQTEPVIPPVVEAAQPLQTVQQQETNQTPAVPEAQTKEQIVRAQLEQIYAEMDRGYKDPKRAEEYREYLRQTRETHRRVMEALRAQGADIRGPQGDEPELVADAEQIDAISQSKGYASLQDMIDAYALAGKGGIVSTVIEGAVLEVAGMKKPGEKATKFPATVTSNALHDIFSHTLNIDNVWGLQHVKPSQPDLDILVRAATHPDQIALFHGDFLRKNGGKEIYLVPEHPSSLGEISITAYSKKAEIAPKPVVPVAPIAPPATA